MAIIAKTRIRTSQTEVFEPGEVITGLSASEEQELLDREFASRVTDKVPPPVTPPPPSLPEAPVDIALAKPPAKSAAKGKPKSKGA